jgi:chromosome partitioning protein
MAESEYHSKPTMKSARVIAIANQKGGSAKTTTSVHLAVALAESGHSTLLVDIDPQGHVAENFAIPAERLEHEISDVLAGEKRITDVIIPHVRPNLDLAPSNIRLSDMELTLVNVRFREHKLKRALEPVVSQYEYLILDCPPNLGLLTVNALIAAKYVLIPMTSEYLSMLGVSLLLKTIRAINSEANPDLAILGVLHTRYKARTLHAREVIARTKDELGSLVRVYDTPIHESTRFAEATGQGTTVFEIAPDLQGALAYRELAKEVADATH